MKSTDLINQLIKRLEVAPPTIRQLELLRSLIAQEIGSPDGKSQELKHLKKVAVAIKRERTRLQNDLEDKTGELTEILDQISALESK